MMNRESPHYGHLPASYPTGVHPLKGGGMMEPPLDLGQTSQSHQFKDAPQVPGATSRGR